MIVSMKKITLAMVYDQASQGLMSLRDLGVLHVESVRAPESRQTERVGGQIECLDQALAVLATRKDGPVQKDPAVPVLETADEILSLMERKKQEETRLHWIQKERDRIAPLGRFSPEDFDTLTRHGVDAKIYVLDRKDRSREDLSVPHEKVGTQGSKTFILAVSDAPLDLPLEVFPLPEKTQEAFEREAEEIRERVAGMEKSLERKNAYRDALTRARRALSDDLAFKRVLAGMGRDASIAYLQGYCPVKDMKALKQKARDMGWALLMEDPSDDSRVPTLIKNPAWIRVIDPVLHFMGTVPGYREVDISFMFLVSLSVFFAMIVGDGGYGLLFLAATVSLRRKLRSIQKEVFTLCCVFSTATVLWGLVSGTWFGVEALSKNPFLNRFLIPHLNSYTDNQDFMIELCFLLGGIHLTLAHGIRAARHVTSLKCLADLGWMSMIWGLYFVAGHFVLGKILPPYVFVLPAGGIFLAAVFSNPQKNFLKSTLLGLADLPLKIISAFSDLVSYLRLFAVGYATLVVATSFNQMAAGFGGHPLVRMTLAAGVLFCGHAVNIIMAIMAVLVHGIRLNMLEFSSHLGMEWSGHAYRPFRKTSGEPRNGP